MTPDTVDRVLATLGTLEAAGISEAGKALGEDFEISPLLKTIAEDGRRFNG